MISIDIFNLVLMSVLLVVVLVLTVLVRRVARTFGR